MSETKQCSVGVFDRGGLAKLSDLEAPEWTELFRFLEKEQAEFLQRGPAFRSPDYRWPHDSLHTWSRIWEYPYAYSHLRTCRSSFPTSHLLRVADFGSGVTFFPFVAAKLGCDVTCIDNDAVCVRDGTLAAAHVPHAPGCIDFRLSGSDRMPLRDAECDAVYCISVLEHVRRLEPTVEDIARCIRPGGLLILTVDLSLDGRGALNVSAYARLKRTLHRHFIQMPCRASSHPLDLLTSNTGPYPLPKFPITQLPLAILHYIRRSKGFSCGFGVPCLLAVEGTCHIRRAASSTPENPGS